MPVREPNKELRFTRSGQATGLWIAAAVLAAAALVIGASACFRSQNPALPHPAWCVLPALLAWLLTRLALRCTRHAYLILTPLGIEIFPFLRPAEGMQLVSWSEIHHAEVDANHRQLTLHFNTEESAGIVLSLAPVRRDRREWLARAVLGRAAARASENIARG